MSVPMRMKETVYGMAAAETARSSYITLFQPSM
jgi:hypothetical protein